MRRRAKKPARFRLDRKDQEFLDFVHTEPCRLLEQLGPALHRCTGVIEADHQGPDKGTGLKDHDRTTVPMCTGAHTDRHLRKGYFAGRSKQWMHDWCADNVSETTARFERSRGRL